MTTPPALRQSASPEIRGLLFRLIASVAALDAVAIVSYYAIHITARPRVARLAFTALWLALTLWFVLNGLARIRAARLRERERRRTGSR